MTEPRRSPLEERVAERRIEVGLGVVFGGERAPDVRRGVERAMHGGGGRAVVLKADRGRFDGGRATGEPEPVAAPDRRPTAALIALGVVVLIAIGVASRGDRDASPNSTHGPAGTVGPSAPATAPQGGPGKVRSASEIRALPVTTSAVHGIRLEADAIKALARLTKLDNLVLSGWDPKVSPRPPYQLPSGAIEQVAGLLGVQVLAFDNMDRVDAKGLGSLMRLPALSDLRFRRVGELGDVHLEACRRLPSLRKLEIEGDGAFTDAGMAVFAAMPALTELKLRGLFGVTGKGFTRLGSLRNLRVLDLSVPWYLHDSGGGMGLVEEQGTAPAELANIDGAVLKALAALGKLRVLRLRHRIGLSGADLAPLRQVKSLEEIDLRGCNNLTDESLEQLPASLQVLDVTECRKLGARLPEHLVALRKVVMTNTPGVVDATVAQVAALPELRHVDVEGCPRLTRASGEALAKVAKLEYLSLKGHAWVDDDLVAEIAELRQLRTLRVGSYAARFRVEGTRLLSGGFNRVTAASVAKLAGLSRLSYLDLAAVQPLPVSCLRALRSLPLEFLGLGWTTIRYDDETGDLEALQALWPAAEVMWWPHRDR